MDSLGKDNALQMVTALSNWMAEASNVLSRCAQEPSTDSKAHTELSDKLWSRDVHDAYCRADLLINGTADHVMAFVKTVTEPVNTLAPFVLVRAALESGALASWLLSPDIGCRERVSRILAFRYEGLVQQKKSADIADKDSVSAIENQIAKVGKHAERLGVAQKMPTMTGMIESNLSEESTWRLLSAVAHAHTWATAQLGYQPTEDNRLLSQNIEPESLVWLCRKALKTLSKPIGYKCRLFGWMSAEFDPLFRSPFDDMG